MTIDKSRVERAIALIKKGSANADYFFEKLASPVWIEPLAKEGLFTKPYDAIRRGEAFSFPPWVPGQYLARMAAIPEAQGRVVEILKKLPASDNPRVYEVVADAASGLPPQLAKDLVLQLLRGIELPFQLLLPEKVGTVIAHLADAGLAREALRLTRDLLAIVPSPTPSGEADEDGLRSIHREARGRMDDWHYARVLDQILESLVRASGLDGLRLMCDLLQEAVAAGRQEAHEGPDDYSYIWRTSVEHSERPRDRIRGDLVSAARDSALQILESSPERIREVVEHLRARPFRIFHRLALFVLIEQGDSDIALVQECLSNPSNWGDVGLHPEYELLLVRFFGQLAPEVQKRYLEWIDQGPEQANYVAFRKRMDGHEPQDAQVQLHRDVWIRDHLGVLATYLSPEDEDRLARLELIGPSREVGRPLYRVSVGYPGEQSPLSEDETLSLDWASLIAKIRDWTPPDYGDFERPSVEGLARSLRQRVTANPPEAIHHLHEIVDVNPQYIAAILEGLRDTIKKQEGVAWAPLLSFIDRIVEVSDAATNDIERWRWVSKCAASLIDDSFEAGVASIPITFREVVWRILERLSQNPDPTPEHEDRYGGSNMDPSTLSFNTVRGETFHAVVRYGLWWRRHLESLPDAGDRLKRGFDDLPEMRALLNRHLDPEFEPSLAVRAVYGQWFPWLALIDERWATSHVGAIFPEDTGRASLFWAAWGAYIVFCRPYASVLPILRSVYHRAITSLRDGMALEVALGERPAEHLAEHLMAYYWRGELTLDEGDLVVAFFEAADPKLRGHALEWVGRILSQLDEPVSATVEERLKALWAWRIGQGPIEAMEMQTFGWWFASGVNDAWALQNLKTLLSASVLPEPDHMVIEHLATIATSQPEEAVKCLDQMIDVASGGWAIHGWLDGARSILAAGLKSRNKEAKEQAQRVVHKLGALRFRDFHTLLHELGTEQVASQE